jgi:membrane-associated protease RseP (regulator of RpoE activity)
MDFMIYDLIFLAIFLVLTSLFLFRKRKNLKKEGLLFLYKTSVGVRIINKIGKKYNKLLNVLSYISIILGFFLMVTIIYLFGKIVWIYVFNPLIVQQIKIPPIMPLIPYIDKIVPNIKLPPFYFTYWIIILAIVAISHEFSHGIFAINKKVKIKSTGFGFFPFFCPVFLAAFVELDEKRMEKKKISSQMAILSAGTFANLLIAILSLGVMVLFFSLAFTPSGVIFDTYTYSAVGLSAITSVNNLSVSNVSYNQLLTLTNNTTSLNEIRANNTKYFATRNILTEPKFESLFEGGYIVLYDNAPAINANLSSVIIKVNGVDVNNREALGKEIGKYSPGDKVIMTTFIDDYNKDYEVVLGKNPSDSAKPYLGIGFLDRKSSGILGTVTNWFTSFKDPTIYYKPNFAAAEFIYNLLWWLVMISFSVALMNMLPVGIFDGGRFFFLAILAITKSEKKAKAAYKFLTYLFLFLVLVIMVFWAISLFK